MRREGGEGRRGGKGSKDLEEDIFVPVDEFVNGSFSDRKRREMGEKIISTKET